MSQGSAISRTWLKIIKNVFCQNHSKIDISYTLTCTASTCSATPRGLTLNCCQFLAKCCFVFKFCTYKDWANYKVCQI